MSELDVHRYFSIAGPSRAKAGPGATFLRAPQTISRGLFGEKNFEFFFIKWCILVYFIFLSDDGAPQTSWDLG